MLNRDQQKLLENISTGRDLTTGDINQKSNTFITLILSGNESISSDEEALISTLSSILAQINPETIQKAYQNSLPPDAELWYSKTDNIDSILTKLDEFRRLVDFFAQLNQDNDISEELRDKLKHYAEKLPPKKPQENKIDNPPSDLSQQLESFVLFTLNSTENKDNFLLNAWLIKDNSIKDISKFQSLLSSDEQQQGTLCKLREIPAKTCNFIKKGLKELRGTRYCLVVEFFLPSHLMLTDIAIWTRSDLPNCNCLSAIDEFLSGKLLCNLCESVRELREEADAHTEEHFGSHLSILWEDPYRLTPDVMVELTPPEF